MADTAKPFSLTYVTYEPQDTVGLLLCVFTLSPIFIMVFYATLIVSRRDILTIYITFGQLIGVAIVIILIKYISQARPNNWY